MKSVKTVDRPILGQVVGKLEHKANGSTVVQCSCKDKCKMQGNGFCRTYCTGR